jgi:cell division initiation protein
LPITPLDIHNKEFRTAMRGYDRNDVDEFLDAIIKDLEQLLRDNASLKEQTSRLQEELAHYHNLDQTLHNALVVAQQTAEEVKAAAKREAQLITREAELKAERLVDDAIAKVRRMTAELDGLRKQAEVFRARLTTILNAQLEMLKTDEWTELDTATANGDDGGN